MNTLTTIQGLIHKTQSPVTEVRGYGKIECRKATAQAVAGWVSADKDITALPSWERLCPKCFK